MKLSDIKRDTTAIAQGQWVGELDGMGDLRLKVRGISTPSVLATKSAKTRAALKKDRMRDGSLTQEAENRIWGEVMAEVILLDWEGVLDENGKPLKYDPALALQLCTHPDWAVFAVAVVEAASRVDADNTGKIEEVSGN